MDKLNKEETSRIWNVAIIELEYSWHAIQDELYKGLNGGYVSREYLKEKFNPIFWNLNIVKKILEEEEI